MADDVQKIIEEYPEDYCLFLEAAYGSHMLSEGGALAIERMFSGILLQDKRLLDIGFGLGGVAIYLADKYHADVSGVEINPWMVAEAMHRVPQHLKAKIHFSAYHPHHQLSFPDQSMDIVYSKGVLTHLQDKTSLFREVYRMLAPGGYFIIDDWLSREQGVWGERLQHMCEMEGLTLYAETEDGYQSLLKKLEFVDITLRDENINYYRYNLDIVARLTQEATKEVHNPIFARFSVEDAIKAYQLIADSIKDNELCIRWICARKPNITTR